MCSPVDVVKFALEPYWYLFIDGQNPILHSDRGFIARIGSTTDNTLEKPLNAVVGCLNDAGLPGWTHWFFVDPTGPSYRLLLHEQTTNPDDAVVAACLAGTPVALADGPTLRKFLGQAPGDPPPPPLRELLARRRRAAAGLEALLEALRKKVRGGCLLSTDGALIAHIRSPVYLDEFADQIAEFITAAQAQGCGTWRWTYQTDKEVGATRFYFWRADVLGLTNSYIGRVWDHIDQRMGFFFCGEAKVRRIDE